MSDSNELRPLFADYVHGEISAEQLQALEAAIRDDDDLRREFIEYMNVDSALGDLAALSGSDLAVIEVLKQEDKSTKNLSENLARRGSPDPDETSDCGSPLRLETCGQSSGSVRRPATTVAKHGSKSAKCIGGHSASFPLPVAGAGRAHRVAAIGAAVALTLLFGAILWLANPQAVKDVPVATLVARVDAALMFAGQAYDGTELVVGEYRLDRGLLHLRFGGGVMVYLEAPARFETVSGKRLVLRSGRLSASVPPEGIGFTVETPDAEVVDFGTEFSVDVESGTSEVHVFEGLVRVQPRSRKDGKAGEAVDLQKSQAVKIDNAHKKPVQIELATDRFIRTFDEPKRTYPRAMKQLSPIAYYRMPIRDKGLVSQPPQYSGVVLTGDGIRPPHACGVVAGGSLRVQADSTGRGGRIDSPPCLNTGQFTLAVFVYLESPTPGGTVATNIRGAEGNFELTLDDKGRLQGTIRNKNDQLRFVTSDALLPVRMWRHLVMTADGGQLRIYEEGQLVAQTPCTKMAASDFEAVWFGTDVDGLGLWDGRIDELALFDRALSEKEIGDLYQAALEEIERSQ